VLLARGSGCCAGTASSRARPASATCTSCFGTSACASRWRRSGLCRRRSRRAGTSPGWTRAATSWTGTPLPRAALPATRCGRGSGAVRDARAPPARPRVPLRRKPRAGEVGLYLKRSLSYEPGIHCIGAAIAFLSGDQARIPLWGDRLGLAGSCAASCSRPSSSRATCAR
jgi:hypothetical protein